MDIAGNFIWANLFQGNAAYIDVDINRNIYRTGWFLGTADFDPSAGVYNLTAPNGYTNVFATKSDSAGNFI